MTFPTDYQSIQDRLDSIDPVAYGKSRNFIDGAVTRLSPYISRGVISTKTVLRRIIDRGYDPLKVEKFVQELAWRDYWQQVWIAKGTAINSDLKNAQQDVVHQEMPISILEAKTGIEAIDHALEVFYKTGYLHNHVRMYVASLCCNVGKSHWSTPARWMYYHLLDADWASNALSWQWVAGANSNKKYFANQDNINKYCYTDQKGTFLDVDYAAFDKMDTPMELGDTTLPDLVTSLPSKQVVKVDPDLPTFIYNFYNLDPKWKEEIKGNRILLLEPSVFSNHPISEKTLDFVLGLSQNISGVQVFCGEFHELVTKYGVSSIHYKEHPLNGHYTGTEEPRDWMFEVKGYYPSFFAFWKKCRRELKSWGQLSLSI